MTVTHSRSRQRRIPDAEAEGLRKSIGELILSWRTEKAGLTREQLAPLMRLSVRTIGRWEHGEGEPRITELFDMERLSSGVVEPVMRLLLKLSESEAPTSD